jgi:hypothetical protein
MLYWLGVYTLVVIVALVPFVLLYVLGCLLWRGIAAIRFTIRSINNALTSRTDFAKTHWNPSPGLKPTLIRSRHHGGGLRGTHGTLRGRYT